ncbi:MAG: SHD1 domain-containing protein [Rubripirellula sp.]
MRASMDKRNRIALLANCVASVLLFCLPVSGAEPLRLWVDATGQFAVEARLQVVGESSVTLLRTDGQTVTLLLDQLSENDKTYLLNAAPSLEMSGQDGLPAIPSSAPDVAPLPLLDLPPAALDQESVTALSRSSANLLGSNPELPGPLPADVAPYKAEVTPGTIPIFRVEPYDRCSPPFAVTVERESGPQTSLAMTVNRRVRSLGAETNDKLVRFDLSTGKAYEAFKYEGTMELLDYHPSSDRLLMLLDFDSSRKGGQLAIGTDWSRRHVKLAYRRSLTNDDEHAKPELKWARWVDEEHIVAVIGEELGLWNLISGVQKYGLGGIDPRVTPAISAGRRYLAVPSKGGVDLYETATGKALGRIPVERRIPNVSFSPFGNALALATTRQMLIWDLPAATMLRDIPSRRSFGTGAPHWIDHDQVVSSSGVLTNLRLGLPVWRYDLSATSVTAVGGHLVMFRKHPNNRLVIQKLPHERAQATIDWVDGQTESIDPQTWQLPGNSQWQKDHWLDQEVR